MNNTVLRTISGTGFVALMTVSLLCSMYLFAAMVIFIMATMMHEFYSMTMGDRYRFSRLLAILSGVVLFSLIFCACAFSIDVKYVSVSILPVMLVMINSLYVKDKTDFRKFSDIFTGVLYIAVPLSLSNLIVFSGHEFDGHILLYFFIIIWCSDVGAYLFGSTLGQKYGKKLFPAISPRKSWIGCGGGLVCAILAAVTLKYVFGLTSISLLNTIILAVVMDVAGVYGDLFESQWKRHYNRKDSGTIIPGHGGMLDRFDSAIMAIPVGALYLIMINIL